MGKHEKIILLSIILAFTSMGTVFPQEILFQDDFESYTPGTFPSSPWILIWDGNDSSNQVIVDNKSISGSQSLKLEGAPGWSAHAEVLLTHTPPTIYCEGYIMVEQDYFPVGIGFWNPDIGFWGRVYASAGTGPDQVLQTCEANKWYHLKLKYDDHLDVFDVWVDGVRKGHNLQSVTRGGYNAFSLVTRMVGSSTKVWFDDVKVYADSLTMMPHIFFTGLYFELAGERDTAKVLIKKALAYIDKNPDLQKPQYLSLGLLRYLHYSEGDFDSVLFYKQRAFDWYNQNGYLFMAMYVSNELGSLYYSKNELKLAEKHYQQSEKIFKEMINKNSWYRRDPLNDIIARDTGLIYPIQPWQMKKMMWILGKSMYKKLYQINGVKKRSGEALTCYIAYSNAKDTLSKLQRTQEQIILNPRGIDLKLDNQKVILYLRQQIYNREYKFKQSLYFLIGLGILVILVVILAIVLIRQYKLRAQQKNLLLQQKLLRSQMNPHFIFNSLSSIQGFIMEKHPGTASRYLSRFATLVRNILDSSAMELVPLDKEISTIENYLELQKARYEDKFEYVVIVDEALDTETMSTPPMLAQPFIENAIEHGFKHKDSKGNLKIRFELKDNLICLEIEDDGVGRKKAQEILLKLNKDHRSMATDITRERLVILNKKLKKKIRLVIIDLKNESGAGIGTKVLFEIPLSLAY